MAISVEGKLRVAVAVRINGVIWPLLRAADRKDKGAIFFPLPFANLEFGGEHLPVLEEHVSIWPNTASAKVHIHHTYNLDDLETRKVDMSTLVDNSRHDFATAIWAATILARNGGTTNINSRYDIHEIPSFDQDRSTLVVCYCAADRSQILPDLREHGIDMVEAEFSSVKVAMYYTYLNVSSFCKARLVHLTSSTARINDGPTAHVASGEVMRRGVDELRGMVPFALASVIHQYLQLQDEALLAAFPDDREELMSLISEYPTVNTIMPVETLRELGVASAAIIGGSIVL